MPESRLPSSFRDPSGFLFYQNHSIYRQVNKIYGEHYDHLMRSGLYQSLVNSELLIRHEETVPSCARSDQTHKIIKPDPISFISYPYEWCFSQLRNAALATLRVQKRALEFKMSLKDASAYNVQFRNGRPIWIDTLSFEQYREGRPWVAYRQFCQHFLAPLTLMSYKDIRLIQLFRIYLDGLPLDLTSSLLPFLTYLRPSVLFHIHFHALSQRRWEIKPIPGKLAQKHFSLHSFHGLLDSLESYITKLASRPSQTHWAGYYDHANSYESQAREQKHKLVSAFIENINPKSVWDLGANTGSFSRLASNKGVPTVAFDFDPECVERNYQTVIANGESNLLPLVLDLTNPSPNIGWENQERMSLFDRGPTDTLLVLALIHHLAIANNLPLDWLARFFKRLCTWLIIEFVPKTDPMVKKLLSTREDIFPNYTEEAFEAEFAKVFSIKSSVKISHSERTIYLMEGR